MTTAVREGTAWLGSEELQRLFLFCGFCTVDKMQMNLDGLASDVLCAEMHKAERAINVLCALGSMSMSLDVLGLYLFFMVKIK